MPAETSPKTKRRRYRTRMFDNRLSFPTTSEQVRQLQAESDAEERSVASLVREAIDESLPRLRRRRKHRQTPGELPARRRRRTSEPLAAAPEADERAAVISVGIGFGVYALLLSLVADLTGVGSGVFVHALG